MRRESHLGVHPHHGPLHVPTHYSFPRPLAAEHSSTPQSAVHTVLFQQNNTTHHPPPQHPHRPDPGLRPVRHQGMRTRERAPRSRFQQTRLPLPLPRTVP